MQKKPFYRYHYSPIKFKDAFPLLVSELNMQTDRKIEYLHSHDVLELGLCLNGSGVFVVEDKIIPFNAGDIAVITSAERHLARSATGTVSRWYWIYVDTGKLLFPLFGNSSLTELAAYRGRWFRNILSENSFPRLASAIRGLIQTYNDKSVFRKEKIVAFLVLILSTIKEELPVQEKDMDEKKSFEPDTLQRIQGAIEFMAKNYHRKIYLEKLAEISKLSVTHFRRLFEDALGQTPFQYLNRIRINMAAAELHRSRKPIGEVALASGFPSISSFNRNFKAVMGSSPRQWRREKKLLS